jgi:uncharacterized membrane protein
MVMLVTMGILVILLDLYTKAACRVHGITLLPRVGTLWSAVTVSFSKYLPWQAMHFLTTPHPLLENVLQTVDHFEISCFWSSLFMAGKAQKSHLDCVVDVLMGFHRSTLSKLNTEFNSYLAPCDFWVFPTMKRE